MKIKNKDQESLEELIVKIKETPQSYVLRNRVLNLLESFTLNMNWVIALYILLKGNHNAKLSKDYLLEKCNDLLDYLPKNEEFKILDGGKQKEYKSLFS